MRSALRDAGVRFVKVNVWGIFALGLIGMGLLIGPSLEVRLAPPVKEWRIVDPKIVGNEIRWFVIVDKKRDCVADVKWFGKWGRETTPLAARWANGESADGSNTRAEAGERATFGPIYASLPRGWTFASEIQIIADVNYKCGSPYPLPNIETKAIAK